MNPRVLVLHDRPTGGRPDEDDVLVQATAVAGALGAAGFEAERHPVGRDLEWLEGVAGESTRVCAFNLVESLEGRGRLIHVVPAVLERIGIPYTGCSARAQLLTSNKRLAKQLLELSGIDTPATYDGAGRGPWIVKSVWEHASFGLDEGAVVASSAAADERLREQREHFGGAWFAERYVRGRELNVAMIESAPGHPRVLPVTEIRFIGFPEETPRFLSYAAKWERDSREYAQTTRSFPAASELTRRLGRIAVECWALFRLSGYARVDFRVDDTGRAWVLEINANPCLSPDSGFRAALERAHIPFETAVSGLVRRAIHPESETMRVGARPNAPKHVQHTAHF